MEILVTLAVSLFNALAALAPQLPGLIDRIKARPDLSPEGRALLDATEVSLDAHVRKLAEIKPLPVPPPPEG